MDKSKGVMTLGWRKRGFKLDTWDNTTQYKNFSFFFTSLSILFSNYSLSYWFIFSLNHVLSNNLYARHFFWSALELHSGEGNGTPLQYFCLENSMDGGAWWAAVHGVARLGHDWATSLSLFTFMHWRRKWQPTPVFLPRESQGQGSLMGCCLWGRTESDMTEAT